MKISTVGRVKKESMTALYTLVSPHIIPEMEFVSSRRAEIFIFLPLSPEGVEKKLLDRDFFPPYGGKKKSRINLIGEESFFETMSLCGSYGLILSREGSLIAFSPPPTSPSKRGKKLIY